MNRPPLNVANAQGFWGDRPDAPLRLASAAPDVDWITLDYLAEVSMSILAKQRQRDPAAGYARDFLGVIESLAPLWKAGRTFGVISNAGGLNPRACAQACAQILAKAGCPMRIGVVSGDDVIELLRASQANSPNNDCVNHEEHEGHEERYLKSAESSSCSSRPSWFNSTFAHLETGQPVSAVIDRIVTANAYLGAQGIVQAIRQGARIIITGRVADPSLTVAPCIAHFGWGDDDYGRIAGATVAGHLIECGAQVTGGISTDWLSVPNPADIGYPIAQIAEDGSCVITKPAGTGGVVNQRTVKEQLVYEIGDPSRYLSPDATVSLLGIEVNDLGQDRVRVGGATGLPPPATYKVSATYRAGFRASGMLTIVGRDAIAKTRRCGDIVRERLRQAGMEPEHFHVECLGGGDAMPIPAIPRSASSLETAAREVVLRITVADAREAVVERFTREIAPLVTTGPQGTTGYAEGRPAVREIFGYWPTLIDRSQVNVRVEMMEV